MSTNKRRYFLLQITSDIEDELYSSIVISVLSYLNRTYCFYTLSIEDTRSGCLFNLSEIKEAVVDEK